MGSVAIKLHDVSYSYPGEDLVMRYPSLQLNQGEQVAVTGRSGCGKTTLLSLIAGLFTPTQGRIEVLDESLSDQDDGTRRAFRAQHIGFIFQEFELLPYLCGVDNILLPYHIHPALTLDTQIKSEATRLLEQADIAHLATRYPSQMSQGERQRVALCRALVTRPKLLLADEPTGNLDPDNAARVMQTIHRYCQDQGATLLAITHDHSLLTAFDRHIDLAEGVST